MIEMAWRNAIGEKLIKLRQVALFMWVLPTPICNCGPLDWIGEVFHIIHQQIVVYEGFSFNF